MTTRFQLQRKKCSDWWKNCEKPITRRWDLRELNKSIGTTELGVQRARHAVGLDSVRYRLVTKSSVADVCRHRVHRCRRSSSFITVVALVSSESQFWRCYCSCGHRRASYCLDRQFSGQTHGRQKPDHRASCLHRWRTLVRRDWSVACRLTATQFDLPRWRYLPAASWLELHCHRTRRAFIDLGGNHTSRYDLRLHEWDDVTYTQERRQWTVNNLIGFIHLMGCRAKRMWHVCAHRPISILTLS